MVKAVIVYLVKEIDENKLLSGFHKAFCINPNPTIMKMSISDWRNYLAKAYHSKTFQTDESLKNLRFYVYIVSGKPRMYQCLFPGYDKDGKVKKVLEHGWVV